MKYFEVLKKLFENIIATELEGRAIDFEKAISKTINLIKDQAKKGGKLLFIGNGASASIASHMATDFWKNANIRALAFNDSSLLTCISNDFGYKHVFEKPIEMFSDANDILIAISSSGGSENILRAVEAARKKAIKIIALSGFDKENPLRNLGDINFYVPSKSYGHVEVVHTSICHSLVDAIMK